MAGDGGNGTISLEQIKNEAVDLVRYLTRFLLFR